MDESLYQAVIPREVQDLIIARIWGRQHTPPHEPLNTLSPYFRYYTDQCRAVFFAFGGKLPVTTHEQLILIADDLLRGLPRSSVKQNLAVRAFGTLVNGAAVNDKCLEGLIDLAVRLIAMLDVGQYPNTHTGRDNLLWTDGNLSLKHFLALTFPHCTQIPSGGIKLSSQFTARNLDLIAGLQVEMTTNIADHLLLREAENTVLIFHHASFLRNQQNDLFPPGFIEETLLTLALLFPARHKKTKLWYRKQDEFEDLDEAVLYCGRISRNILEYHYWRDRLVVLKERFDEPHRTTWRQLWNDRREGTQWYALWVAVSFTVFFGLVQSIEGALQVYKAFRSN